MARSWSAAGWRRREAHLAAQVPVERPNPPKLERRAGGGSAEVAPAAVGGGLAGGGAGSVEHVPDRHLLDEEAPAAGRDALAVAAGDVALGGGGGQPPAALRQVGGIRRLP